MKTMKFIVMTIFSMAVISSCTVEEYYTNDDVYEENWYVQDFTVENRHWELVGGEPGDINSYYEYVFDKVPLEVSYYDGIVTAYIYFDYNTPYEVQTPLPYTKYMVGENEYGEEVFYSIQYSYDVKADGTIAFKAYVSDYFTDLFEPGKQIFRVAIIW